MDARSLEVGVIYFQYEVACSFWSARHSSRMQGRIVRLLPDLLLQRQNHHLELRIANIVGSSIAAASTPSQMSKPYGLSRASACFGTKLLIQNVNKRPVPSTPAPCLSAVTSF